MKKEIKPKIYSKYKTLIIPKPTKECLKESQKIMNEIGDYKLISNKGLPFRGIKIK